MTMLPRLVWKTAYRSPAPWGMLAMEITSFESSPFGAALGRIGAGGGLGADALSLHAAKVRANRIAVGMRIGARKIAKARRIDKEQQPRPPQAAERLRLDDHSLVASDMCSSLATSGARAPGAR